MNHVHGHPQERSQETITMGLATAIAPTTFDALPDTLPESPPIPSDMLYEVINGEIVEKIVGIEQVDIAAILDQILGAFARSNQLGRVFPEMVFRIDKKKNLQRRPDVAFVSDARWPFRKRVPTGAAWDVIPDLAVEVVSPTNSAYEMQEKVQHYLAAGVAEMWIIYPNVRLLHRYTSPTQIQVIQSGEELDGGALFPGFRMPWSELFEDDPE
jgi:Uma2 family endonuclease